MPSDDPFRSDTEEITPSDGGDAVQRIDTDGGTRFIFPVKKRTGAVAPILLAWGLVGIALEVLLIWGTVHGGLGIALITLLVVFAPLHLLGISLIGFSLLNLLPTHFEVAVEASAISRTMVHGPFRTSKRIPLIQVVKLRLMLGSPLPLPQGRRSTGAVPRGSAIFVDTTRSKTIMLAGGYSSAILGPVADDLQQRIGPATASNVVTRAPKDFDPFREDPLGYLNVSRPRAPLFCRSTLIPTPDGFTLVFQSFAFAKGAAVLIACAAWGTIVVVATRIVITAPKLNSPRGWFYLTVMWLIELLLLALYLRLNRCKLIFVANARNLVCTRSRFFGARENEWRRADIAAVRIEIQPSRAARRGELYELRLIDPDSQVLGALLRSYPLKQLEHLATLLRSGLQLGANRQPDE